MVYVTFLYVAVVRDTDGSAFITKAEFDSLKNNFQAQIDNYNSSIDSKIDGAIAAYLAGVSTAVEVQHTCIGYDASGVLSVLPYENIDWEEGDIYLNVDLVQYGGKRDGSYYPGWAKYTLPGMGVRPGHTGPNECLVTVFNRSNSTDAAGLWRGRYVDDRITFVCAGFSMSTSGLFKPVGTQGTYDTKVYLRNSLFDQSATKPDTPLRSGWFVPVSNNEFTNTGGSGGTMFFACPWGRNSMCNQSSWSCNNKMVNCTRTLGARHNVSIISASNLNEFGRFTDYDGVYDWCNDTRFDGHSIVTSETEYFKTPTFTSAVTDGTDNWTGPFTAGWGNPMADPTPYISWIKANLNTNSAQSSLYPYVGFVKNLNNFNKIYTDKYTTFAQDVLVKHPELSVYNDTNNNLKYVNVGAGFIFGEVKENNVVKVPIKFEDETKNYDIWFRVGPFDPSKSAWEADSVETIYSDDTCLTALPLGAHPHSRVVNGAQQYVYLKPNTAGYLFMMWTYNDINKNGGGVFLPDPNYISISEN